MKLLMIHSDHIEYRVTKAIKEIAEKGMKDNNRMEECLVAFCTVESKDADFIDDVVDNTIKNIHETAERVRAERIMIYPYAHLSSDLAKPNDAVEIMKRIEEGLGTFKFDVTRSPFGWYKAFEISCKGHPLSELSREIRPWQEEKKKKDHISEALKSEENARSEWFIMDIDGEMHPLTIENEKVIGFDTQGYKNLNKFLQYEISRNRSASKEPPHVKYMRKLEIADYEPGSDPGNMRYYPKGRFIKSLLERYVTSRVKDYGGMEIESPIMYDFEHPSLKSYLDRFPARQYTIDTPDKRVFLRFAACFGQFLMAHDSTISYKHLPLRLYELTRYSFRVEQRGELSGLRRLRAFTMPDCHAFCADLEQAKEEMIIRFELARSILKDIGMRMPEDMQMAVRVTKDFFDENTEFIKDMVRSYGHPVLIEMWTDRFFYFVLKYEFNFVDATGKASALTTDQIDVENAQRYGINYTDKEGSLKNPLILHLSPSGAIERLIYAMLEKAYIHSTEGKPTTLPYWISPTQLRLIPVTDDHIKLCKNIAERMKGVRVDIEDTDRTVGRKMRDAEREWIPFVAVIGDREAETGVLNIRKREPGKPQVKMSIEDLKKELSRMQGDMPWENLGMPTFVSMRPKFVG